MRSGNKNFLGTGQKIHRSAHSRTVFAFAIRHCPIGYVAHLVYFKRSEHCHIYMASADNKEGCIQIEHAASCKLFYRSSPGAAHAWIVLAYRCGSSKVKHSILGLKGYIHSLRDIVSCQNWYSKTQIHNHAILEFLSRSFCYDLFCVHCNPPLSVDSNALAHLSNGVAVFVSIVSHTYRIDKNSRCAYIAGWYFTDFYDFFNFGNSDLGGGRHYRIRIRGSAVKYISGFVGLESLDYGNIRTQCGLKEVFLSVDDFFLLAFLY